MRNPPWRSAVRHLLIALAVGMTLTGCTASPGADSAPASGAVVVGNVAQRAAAPAQGGEPTVLASLTASAGEIPVQVDLNDLRIAGQATELTFTARNAGQGTDTWQVAQFFDSGSGFEVDGIYLLDTKNAKRYLAALTSDNACVCTSNLSGTFISAGHGIVFYSLFAALPPEVDTVDIVVPNVGTFVGVRPGR